MRNLHAFVASAERPERLSTRLTVALCTAGEIWGGIEQCVETIARYLHHWGHSVVVIVLEDGLLAERLRAAGIRTEVITARSPYDPRLIGGIVRVLKRERVDVLHTHGYRATVLGALSSLCAPVRLVRTEHGSLEPVGASGWWRRRINIALETVASRWFADTVVFVTKNLRDQSRNASRGSRQYVIYNGIEPPEADSEQRALEAFDDAAGLFNIGIVGRLVPIKGHEYLFAALERLESLDNVRLYVFGSGPLEDVYRRRCSAGRLRDVVRFMGFRHDVRDYLRRLDLLAMPSIHEGLPYTLLEALYLGVPVLASNVGGVPEVIQDGETGILVPARNPAALAAAIQNMRGDEMLRRRIARNGRRLVEQRFMASHMTQQYVAAYLDVRRSLRRAWPVSRQRPSSSAEERCESS